MGADAETLNQWTPAPALTEPVWVPWTHACGQRWASACGRVKVDIAPILGTPDWMYEASLTGQRAKWRTSTVSEGAAKRLGLDAAQELLAKLDAKADSAGEWRLHPTGMREWTSPCGRVAAQVWANTHDRDWRWTVDSPSQAVQTVGNPAPSREEAQALALDTAGRRIAEMGDVPAFVKADANKPRADLLPPRALLAVSSVLGYGAAKYSPDNHLRDGSDVEGRYMGATLRHLLAHMGGEANDNESGMPHLAHAAANLLLLLERAAKGAK